MAGRPLTRARRLAAEQAALSAPVDITLDEPTPRREEPATYTPELDAEVLVLADHGYCYVEIAAHLAVSEEVMKGWEDAHPSFSAAITNARTREKAWWMGKPRIAMRDDNNRFPAGLWSHVARARWPEFDKPDITVNVDITKRLVLIDLRTPGLLGEQVGSDGQALIEHDTVRLASSSTGEKQPSDHPTIPTDREGGVEGKTPAVSPHTPHAPDFFTPPLDEEDGE